MDLINSQMSIAEQCQQEIVSKKRRRRRKWPTNLKCAICNQPCSYAFYGVHCCEGCKQFFRRTIVHQSRWICDRDNKCGIGNQQIIEYNCKSCRFDKCLSVGMNWGSIGTLEGTDTTNAFFEELKQRRKKLMAIRRQQQHQIIVLPLLQNVPDENFIEDRLLKNFLRVEHLQHRIYEAYFSLPDEMFKLIDVKEYLVNKKGLNILSMAHIFPESPVPFYLDQQKPTGFFANPRILKIVATDQLLAIGTAMTMPAFSKLNLEDQFILLRNVIKPMNFYCNCIYSARLGLQFWGHIDGLEAISFFSKIMPQISYDKKLNALYEQICMHSMKPFLRICPISTEELILMQAILHSHSTDSDLSPSARDLLYSESVRYSKMLLKLQQTRLGPVAGAQRYSECLLLVEHCYHGAQQMEIFETYLETFYYHKSLESCVKDEGKE